MRVLVTRPAAQAGDWVRQLRAAGFDAVALPLIGIDPAPDAAAVRAAWAGLGAQRLVVFVSPNAAASFMAARPTGTAWPDGALAAAVGPGTARALHDAGVPAGQIVVPDTAALQFDSEALWLQLQQYDWRGAAVLVVRGNGGREWLADTLRAHGAEVALLAAYRRSMPRWDAPEAALLDAALAAPRRHLWLFSSSEAVGNLAVLAGTGVDWSHARAAATHPRIAAAAQQLGLREVVLAAPDLAAVSACIQSMTP